MEKRRDGLEKKRRRYCMQMERQKGCSYHFKYASSGDGINEKMEKS